MFIETVTAPREVWEQWSTRLRLFSEPPAALVAAVAWDAGDGMITSLNVWDNPSAVADFFVDRVQPVVEAEGPGYSIHDGIVIVAKNVVLPPGTKI